ncbi:hypothetical protein F8271_08950 [Micromonospora sp. ALFpr18c]|uniref:hypothetical protein n=1 Tax=Micromonospora sp. ALFpr18c TaxID=1458665 RepID=UPI00124BA44F|nr:hypothetical protein [Micromonospora sp. ALFpr18c]KAB1944608.1 hypothetical protein F8271_08950 [Micromonospora sp. ALFpr18c]
MRYIVDHLPPGTTIKRQVLIVNRTDERQKIDVYPAAASLEKGKFAFGEGHASNELTSWITLDHEVVELEPSQEARVRATITVPEKASAGERYGVIWASAVSAPRPSGSVTQIHRVGIRIYLDIGPGGEPASDFTIGEMLPARSPQGEPSVAIEVSNTGGRALDLTGRVSLSEGPAGSRAGPFDVVQGTTLAPGASGQVTVRFPNELANGPWKIQVNLESGLVKKDATRQIEFPAPGKVGKPGTLLSRMAAGWNLAMTAAGLLVVAGLIWLARRHRKRLSAAR